MTAPTLMPANSARLSPITSKTATPSADRRLSSLRMSSVTGPTISPNSSAIDDVLLLLVRSLVRRQRHAFLIRRHVRRRLGHANQAEQDHAAHDDSQVTHRLSSPSSRLVQKGPDQ